MYQAGLRSSPWQHSDDTSTRLNGQNQHCQLVCNPLYTADQTTAAKDRLTIIDVLRNRQARCFRLNAAALNYLSQVHLSQLTRQRLLLSTWLAAICGLFGAIVAVLFLSKGIVARVQQVQGNAQRLALGQPLLPQPPENDEIGQLGTRLVEAGLLLAERERALRENEER